MFEEVVTKKTKHNLGLLSKLPNLKSFYLAGGTGLAFQLAGVNSSILIFLPLSLSGQS